MVKELQTAGFWRDLLAETVATFLLVAIQCALPLTWGGDGDLLKVALGMGLVVIAMAESLGPFGGAVMNPAVTVGLMVARKISPIRGLFYLVMESAGGICGAGYVFWVTSEQYRESLAATTLHEGVSVSQGVGYEALITFILMSSVLGAGNQERKPVFMASLPIGFSVALGIMAAGSATGASMNPARSLGPAVMMNIWTDHWVYWVGPISGAIVAVIFYSIFDMVDKKSIKKRPKAEQYELNGAVESSREDLSGVDTHM